MSQPLFSVVIANYNYGRFLEEAIRSVLTQSCQDFELIIIDGSSTDNSVEVIKKYGDRISYWISEKDSGQSDAFNKGFAKAHGRFLTWLNADDIFTSGALAAVKREIVRHPQCEWFVGSSLYADANLKVTKCFCAHRFSVLRARWGTMSVGGPSSFFTKRALDAVGGLDVGLHYVMDIDLWFKFYFKLGLKYRRTRHNIFAYRQHEASKTGGANSYVTERALENRRKTTAECEIPRKRYGTRGGVSYRLAQYLSFSFADRIVALYRDLKWKGRYATEI